MDAGSVPGAGVVPGAETVTGGWIDVVDDGGALVGVRAAVGSLDAGVEVGARSTLVSDSVADRIDDGSSDPATAPSAVTTTNAVTA